MLAITRNSVTFVGKTLVFPRKLGNRIWIWTSGTKKSLATLTPTPEKKKKKALLARYLSHVVAAECDAFKQSILLI